jgi:arginyl-tRNA synthetase
LDPLKEFIGQIEEIIQNFLINENIEEDLDDYGIKNSPQPQFGDYNTSISFRLAKILRENPKSIAKTLFSSI